MIAVHVWSPIAFDVSQPVGGGGALNIGLSPAKYTDPELPLFEFGPRRESLKWLEQ